MRRGYGQGNGPTRARTLRMNRRYAENVRTTDQRDMGIRPGVVERLGLDGERHAVVQASCGCFLPPDQVEAHLAWLEQQRDPVTGELPFGVY